MLAPRGMKLGAVKQIVIEDGEHTMTFDRNLYNVAAQVADFLATKSKRWTDGPKKRRDDWLRKSLEERQSVGKEYVDAVAVERKKMRLM